ncbi:DUF998 domain-containing protein [Streptomyces sp. NPDC088745]|uniref:DUF998 domain-containing protein n=1 Tax=Streptomyces sp. NPDC088745 TaxID=3365884 RepID=UPI0037FF33DC
MTPALTSPATRTATPARTAVIPSRPGDHRALRCAVAAGPLFLGAGAAQALTRDGFDLTRNALSQLALGGAGWVQALNFLVAGALLLVGASGLRRTRAAGRGGPVLIAVFGLSFWAAAAFPADAGAGFPVGAPEATAITGTGAAHMAAGMIGYLALCAAFFVLARPLAERGHRTWAAASRVVPAVVLAGFTASAVSVLAFTAGAALGLLWLSAVLLRLTATPVPH